MKAHTSSISLSIEFYFIIILVLNGSLNLNASSSSLTKNEEQQQQRRPRLLKRNSLDSLYEETDEATIEIGPEEQARGLLEAQISCIEKIKTTTMPNLFKTRDICDIRWDSVQCWPETLVNTTVYIPCPVYINKFNRKNKAVKHCGFNPNTSKAEWSKTNYTFCQELSVYVKEDLMETTVFDKHLKYIMAINICGYIISLLSLTLSVIILLRPKLRCPRNYVHINLFLAFGLRTVLTLLKELLRSKTQLFSMNVGLTYPETTASSSFIETSTSTAHLACRIIIFMYRYSGSVYHVSIFSEAIYLMLLLKFPYYSEKKGSKFCIMLSWTMPFVWMVPWVLLRTFIQESNKWCWNMRSTYNLIIDCPHTLLLLVNVICTIFIIKILYSKMLNRNMSKEKLIKYRRLAKSILILIPIFGLHFTFFAWLPYVSYFTDDISILEIPALYIESFFNAFQGFVVSIACCFIQREFRLECLLYFCELLRKVKIFNRCDACFYCLNTDFIQKIRYQSQDIPRIPLSEQQQLQAHNRMSRQSSHATITSPSHLATLGSSNPAVHLHPPPTATRYPSFSANRNRNLNNSHSHSRQHQNQNVFEKVCCCLSTTHKNDFYQSIGRKKSSSPYLAQFRTSLRRKSRSSSVHSPHTLVDQGTGTATTGPMSKMMMLGNNNNRKSLKSLIGGSTKSSDCSTSNSNTIYSNRKSEEFELKSNNNNNNSSSQQHRKGSKFSTNSSLLSSSSSVGGGGGGGGRGEFEEEQCQKLLETIEQDPAETTSNNDNDNYDDNFKETNDKNKVVADIDNLKEAEMEEEKVEKEVEKEGEAKGEEETKSESIEVNKVDDVNDEVVVEKQQQQQQNKND